MPSWREEFQKAGLDKKVWQYFTVVPDFKSVGVRDNARSFEWPVITVPSIRIDAMTATYRTRRLAYPNEDYGPHSKRSQKRQPRLLRYVSETQCDDRMGIR